MSSSISKTEDNFLLQNGLRKVVRLTQQPNSCAYCSRIENTITRRETYVLYYYPMYRNILDESGFLTVVKETSVYSVYKALCGDHPSLPREKESWRG